MTTVTFFKPTSSNFYDLLSGEDLKNLVESKDFLVVDIYATWCAPCKHVGPKFENMTKSYPELTFAKINIEVLSNAQTLDYKITVLPTFLYFKNGVLVDKVMGANIVEIEQKLNQLK